MNIKLDDKYYLTSDTQCITLHCIAASKGEKKEEKGHGNTYYPTVKMALQHYLNEAMKESTSINEVLMRIDEVEARIENLNI